MSDQESDVDFMKGLEAQHQRMVELESRLSAQVAPESSPAQGDGAMEFLDSEIMSRAGYEVGRLIGEGIVSLFANLVPSPEERGAARARAAIASTPAAIVPAPVPVESPSPGQKTSNEIRVDVEGPNFVGHVEDVPRRLDLENDVRHQVRRDKLKGPIIGISE